MGSVLRLVFVFDEYTADFIFVVNSTKTNKRSFSLIICLFVCLFVLGFLSREFFTHMEILPWLQILTYVRHSWSLSSEGSYACHI